MIGGGGGERVSSLEALCAKICKALLERHEYASFAEVRMSAEYFLERKPEGGQESLEPFKLMAKATAMRADALVEIVWRSLSSPTYGILKRKDEANVVLNAHLNPKFVEDVVRDILGKLLEKYKDLDDSVHVTVRSVSEESIHKHDALAERVTTLGELRAK